MDLPAPLRPIVDDPSGTVLLVDFDGTLAPIVDDPATSRALPGSLEALRRLSVILRRVAVVSGRPGAFLLDRVGVAGVELVGSYGLERVVDGAVVTDPRIAPWVDAVTAAATRVEAELPRVDVERKGVTSVTLHWRRSPDDAVAGEALGRELATESGLAVVPGRMAMELRPPIAVDKGTVAREIAAGATSAVFVGDDEGDLAAFAALRDLVAAGALARAITVGVDSEEAPSGLAAADVLVDGPGGCRDLLTALTAAVT